MKSYGGRGRDPGRKPGKPNRGVPPSAPGGFRRPYLNESYGQENENLPAFSGRENERQLQEAGDDEAVVVRIEPGKRAGALLIDFVIGYLISVIVAVPLTLIPYFRFMPQQFLLPIFLLFRDAFFEGRGVGKNLMGLQVVDANTGQPCTLKQSFIRNIVLLLPYVVLLVVQLLMSFTSVIRINQPWWDAFQFALHDIVSGVINILGMVYVAIVLPVECYRAWRREDSLRKGDELAGTMVVEGQMDFSNPLPRMFS
ncbi:MAG TPA: RDD family protein [Candidatus Obscuribacterales bacterium]